MHLGPSLPFNGDCEDAFKFDERVRGEKSMPCSPSRALPPPKLCLRSGIKRYFMPACCWPTGRLWLPSLLRAAITNRRGFP